MSAGCEVWFYHLEQTTLDQALPDLLERTLARGWRALVRSPDRQRLDHLDIWLWTYRDDSFLPHGLAEEPQAARQPILLAQDGDAATPANQPHALFLLDDADAGGLTDYARCILLFDGRDETMLAAARQRWRALKAQGHACVYWRQGERGWEKQAG